MRSPRRLHLVELALVLMATAGLAFAGSGAAGGVRHPVRLRPLDRAFAIVRDAHLASAQPVLSTPPTGATSTTYAATEPDGSELFAATLVDGEVCLIDQEPQQAGQPDDVRTGFVGIACGTLAGAELRGIGLVYPSSAAFPAVAAILVPDGVRSVSFELTDGSAVSVPVANNVAWYSSAQLASIVYVMPDGATVSTAAAAPSS